LAADTEGVRHPPSLRSRLGTRLSSISAEIDKVANAAGVSMEDVAAAPSGGDGAISVVIGTSALAEQHAGLDGVLTDIITRAYEAVGGNPRMLQSQPVAARLRMGDYGTRTNRVLHVAFQGKQVVGCISSSLATLWTGPSVGHWGLLAVDPTLQGRGIASALVASAESRLAEACSQIHIEYDFYPGREHSQRLRNWYEKLGFVQKGSEQKDGGGEFCFCRKRVPKQSQTQGKLRRLQAERLEVETELRKLEGAAGPGAEGSEGADDSMKSFKLFDALTALVQASGAELMKSVQGIFQISVADFEEEGRFVVDLRNGKGSTKVGLDPKAYCTLEMVDADLVELAEGRLDPFGDAFWDGRVKFKGFHQHLQALVSLFESVRKG